jgi:hypothetical protein
VVQAYGEIKREGKSKLEKKVISAGLVHDEEWISFRG